MNLTQAAKIKLNNLLTENPGQKYLRVYILGGGCSGFQYGFELTSRAEEDDLIFQFLFEAYDLSKDLAVVIDSISLTYLKDSTIDYKKDLTGQHFIISNPNIKTTCGCGLSFSLDD
jgi:iron-sulfur cluster insertion protein